MSETQIVGFLVFIFGTVIGSFLNVCIVRLPVEKSIVFPASHCVNCKTPILWYDNVPLLSYMFLLGKCRTCSAAISSRYFVVESLTGLSFLWFYSAFGLTPVFFSYLVMLAGFIVATFVDLEHRIIPDQVSVGGLAVGLVLSALIPSMHQVSLDFLGIGQIVMWAILGACVILFFLSLLIDRQPMDREDFKLFILIGFSVALEAAVRFFIVAKDSALEPYLFSFDSALIGYLVGGGSIYLMGMIGDLVFRKESMGGGDVKLMAMVGAFMGWKLSLLAFFIAPFFGAVWGVAQMIRTKDHTMAYGPFLVIGALISLFKGDEIIKWLIQGYGLY